MATGSDVFRIRRDKLVEKANAVLAEDAAKKAAYKDAVEAYEVAVGKWIYDNPATILQRIKPAVRWDGDLNVSLNIDAREIQPIIGMTYPERITTLHDNVINDIKTQLDIIALSDGEYVPQKIADKLLRLL